MLTHKALLPTLFLSHGGGPCFFMKGGVFTDLDSSSPKANFLRSLAGTLNLPIPPTSLLIVSAHWEGERDTVHIQSGAHPPLLFDYHGFPSEAYELTWPAPGSPALSTRVSTLLTSQGFKTTLDSARGFDHGVFVPLKLVFPKADIPTIQVSLHGSLGMAKHIALGRALAPLRGEGTLIIGSGFATHNLRDITRVPGAQAERWAVEFDQWLGSTLLGGGVERGESGFTPKGPTVGAPQDFNTLVQAMVGAPTMAPHFARAHPRIEHLLPLYVALGAADPEGGGAGGAGAGEGNSSEASVSSRGERVGDGEGEGKTKGTLRVTELYTQIVMGSASLSSFRFD